MVTTECLFFILFLLWGEHISTTDSFITHLRKYPYRGVEHFPYEIDQLGALHVPTHGILIDDVTAELNKNLEPKLNI